MEGEADGAGAGRALGLMEADNIYSELGVA
jgi:hypothetical protein